MGTSCLSRHPVTPEAVDLVGRLLPALREVLYTVDRQAFDDLARAVGPMEVEIEQCRGTPEPGDDLLNDLFVLERVVAIYRTYSEWWSLVLGGSFKESWGSLQAALNAVADVKRFSRFEITNMEYHLLQIEAVYPYKVFASMGAVVSRWECSVCGQDMEGVGCPHRRGELYAGQVAHAIANDIQAIDHVSLVENPADRMCVVGDYDDASGFPVLAYLRDQVRAGDLRPTHLLEFEQGVRRARDPEIPEQGRNEGCVCGSGMKHKRCCWKRAYLEIPHVELVPKVRDAAVLLPSLDQCDTIPSAGVRV